MARQASTRKASTRKASTRKATTRKATTRKKVPKNSDSTTAAATSPQELALGNQVASDLLQRLRMVAAREEDLRDSSSSQRSFREEQHVMTFDQYRHEPKADDFADAVVQGLAQIDDGLRKAFTQKRARCGAAVVEEEGILVRSLDVGPKHCAVAELRIWSLHRWRIEKLFNVNFLEDLLPQEAAVLHSTERMHPAMNCQNIADEKLVKLMDAYFANPAAHGHLFGAPGAVDAFLIERQPTGFRARGSKNALISYILMRELYAYQRSWPGRDMGVMAGGSQIVRPAAFVSAKKKLRDVTGLLTKMGVVSSSSSAAPTASMGITDLMIEAMTRLCSTRCGPKKFAAWYRRFGSGSIRDAVRQLAARARRAGCRSDRTTSNIRYTNNKVWSSAILGCLLLQSNETLSQRALAFEAQLIQMPATSRACPESYAVAHAAAGHTHDKEDPAPPRQKRKKPGRSGKPGKPEEPGQKDPHDTPTSKRQRVVLARPTSSTSTHPHDDTPPRLSTAVFLADLWGDGCTTIE